MYFNIFLIETVLQLFQKKIEVHQWRIFVFVISVFKENKIAFLCVDATTPSHLPLDEFGRKANRT